MVKMTLLDKIAGILALVGGINWGLVGLLSTDLVQKILPQYAKWVYIIIGAASAYFAFRAIKRFE